MDLGPSTRRRNRLLAFAWYVARARALTVAGDATTPEDDRRAARAAGHRLTSADVEALRRELLPFTAAGELP